MHEFVRLLRYTRAHKGKLCVSFIGAIQPILDLALSPRDAPSVISLPNALQDRVGPLVNDLGWVLPLAETRERRLPLRFTG